MEDNYFYGEVHQLFAPRTSDLSVSAAVCEAMHDWNSSLEGGWIKKRPFHSEQQTHSLTAPPI